MKVSKKAQVGGIQAGFYALMFMAVALIVVVIINAFGADYVNSVQDSTGLADCTARTDDYTTYNSTGKYCQNSTNSSQNVPVGTYAFNITQNGLDTQETLSEGTDDVTDVGIITIVLGLLVALIGLFGWYGYNRVGG